jgi:hypothetical protein
MWMVAVLIIQSVFLQNFRAAAESLSGAQHCCPDCTSIACPVQKTVEAPACHTASADSSPYKLDHRCSSVEGSQLSSDAKAILEFYEETSSEPIVPGLAAVFHAPASLNVPPDTPPPKSL